MSETQRPCLSAPEILAYLGGELGEAGQAAAGRHLDECRLCAAAVEGVAGLEWREGFLKSADALRARVRARTAAAVVRRPSLPRFRPAPLYLTLAASLLVGVGATVILTRPGPGEVLFRRHFEPYPSTRPVVRGSGGGGGSPALALYEGGDYRGALAAFEDGLRREPNDSAARFYAGVCRLALGRTREASLDLEQVLRLESTDLHAPAEWYLALAHLRDRDLSSARPHLERIAASDGFYRDRARALLAELEASRP